MQIGSIRNLGDETAVRVDGDDLVCLPFSTHELLESALWDIAAADHHDGTPFARIAFEDADWAPIVSRPGKIFCVGLNYREHVEEMGREIPPAPTYFAKFADALIGAHDNIVLPRPDISTAVDSEVELCIVIGAPARHVDAANALDHVAGYTILNDISVRDWQKRTTQFLAGKTFEAMTPVGPVLTTADVLGDATGLAVQTKVDGVVKQSSTTNELIFGVRDLIADLSKVCTLRPGDLIATGTPSGVGAARIPPEWLAPGNELVTTIEGIGELRNRFELPA
jgi:acylpyruvate hydrolase